MDLCKSKWKKKLFRFSWNENWTFFLIKFFFCVLLPFNTNFVVVVLQLLSSHLSQVLLFICFTEITADYFGSFVPCNSFFFAAWIVWMTLNNSMACIPAICSECSWHTEKVHCMPSITSHFSHSLLHRHCALFISIRNFVITQFSVVCS